MKNLSSALVSSLFSSALGSRRLSFGRGAAGICALGFALSSAACSDPACFQWTEAEGACPSQEEALPFFQDPSCPQFSDVQGVESDGEFIDDACCYDVVRRDNSFEGGCFGGIPVSTGVVGAAATGGGFTGTSVASSSGGGFGGAGGMSGAGGAGGSECITCAEAITAGESSGLCASSQPLFDDFASCMCVGACAGDCANECEPVEPVSMECQQCVTDVMVGCGMQFNACSNDF